jgi:hypothetical protein
LFLDVYKVWKKIFQAHGFDFACGIWQSARFGPLFLCVLRFTIPRKSYSIGIRNSVEHVAGSILLFSPMLLHTQVLSTTRGGFNASQETPTTNT